jgi:DNA/RNA endonuclease YhcR with UshA esterase domain
MTKKVIEILTEYANKRGVIVRSTSDVSPLEEYLIMELIDSNQEITRLKLLLIENRINF